MKTKTEHETLRDAGFTEEQLTRLEDAGVIKQNGESATAQSD